jgi:hypothetical protein
VSYYANFVLWDVRGRVQSQITSVALQIQWFDFDCNLVLTNRLILGMPPALRFKKPLYYRLPKFSTKIRYICTLVRYLPR